MAQYDFDLREYWRIVKKRKYIIAFTTVAMGLFSLMFAIISAPPPIYKATASVKFERISLSSTIIPTAVTSLSDDIQTQMSVIKSYFILELAAKKMKMIPENLSSDEISHNQQYIGLISRLKSSIETEQETTSAIINVSVSNEDADMAARFANSLVSAYMEQRSYELNKRAVESRKFVEDQLKISKEKLAKSEDAIRDFREKHKLVSIETLSNTLLGQFSQFKTSFDRLTSDLVRLREVMSQLDGAENRPLSSKTSFYLEEASPGYKAFNDRLVQLMMDRDSFLVNYTDKYPQVVELKNRIHDTVLNMQTQLKVQINVMADTSRNLKQKMDQTDREIKGLPELGLELTRLEREARVNTEVYTQLQKSYQEYLVKESDKVEDVQIVRPALKPAVPTNPARKNATAGVGTLLGLVLGIVFAFLIETFDTSIGTIDEVEAFLGVPVLGVIPHMTDKDIAAFLGEKESGGVDDSTIEHATRLISLFAPQSSLSESYRALRTNLNFACQEKNIRALAITSSSLSEGKTTTSLNLALVMAQTGQKVLLVEADMRRPVIARILGIDQTPGLSDALLGGGDWEKSVKTIADIMMGKLNFDELIEAPGIDSLHVIPAGTIPSNPSELINSKMFTDLIKWGKENYDFVLIDTPPVLVATDTSLIGSYVEGVIIVYRVGRVSRMTLRRAKHSLENVKVNVIGVVLNGIKADISSDFSDYDYKYYQYYGGSTRERKPFSEKIKNFFANIAKPSKWLSRKKESRPSNHLPEENGKQNKDTETEVSHSKHHRKSSGWRVAVLLAAVAALAGGAAWQTGYLRAEHLKILYTRIIQAYYSVQEKNNGKANGFKKTISRSEEKIPPAQLQVATPVEQNKALSIQVTALRDVGEASHIVNVLRGEGFDAFSVKADLKKAGVWYRICVGHFSSKEEAQRYLTEKKLVEKFPGSFPRLVEDE